MKIRDAVSAVFAYQGRVFMIVRQPYLPAFPGYLAFPGGKVDRDERTEPLDHPLLQGDEPRLMQALIREVAEELNFDLAEACDTGLVTQVSYLCSATTPPFEHYRFCNRFYRIDLNEPFPFDVDSEEAADSGWIDPTEQLDHWSKGRRLMIPPLRVMLKALAEDPERRHIPDVEFLYDEDRYVPVMPLFPELWLLPVRSNTLPPATRTNSLVVGSFLIDPSPADEEELERLIHSLEDFPETGFTVSAIMLTHHHPDHHQFANDLARRKGWPIYCSADTHGRIEVRKGIHYFEDIEVHHLADGEVLTQWQGQDVTVYALPGHDEGQLGIAPADLSWFLVGDLIQGVGTVVISAPEGHMGRYFQSLERVIALAPKIIIPSHGIAMGGTYRLEATLAHRREREEEVRRLFGEGKSKRTILDTIYQGLDEQLRPLAMANIEAHLVKLKEDGVLP